MTLFFPLNSLDLEPVPPKERRTRPGCVVCDDEQTDLVFVHQDLRERPSLGQEIHVGFPVCDSHTLADLAPDQYVLDNLVVEVY